MTFTTESLTLEQFAARVRSFNWTRRITALHLHHTWQPNHTTWLGERSVIGMRDYHMNKNKWGNIAQHITVAPDGGLWTGRPWNDPPISSTGHNGTSRAGPFMWEMVGNFDKPPAGMDRFTGPQRIATLVSVGIMAALHGLDPRTSVHFHRNLGSTKTCPGTGIDRDAVLEDVAVAVAALRLTLA